MNANLIATASVVIDADRHAVWNALVDPAAVREYMFGTTVESRWQPGSPITWSGEWKGQPYQDKGVIQTVEPESLLTYTHFSPLSGQADEPENYHTVSVSLVDDEGGTRVTLTQDGNSSDDEQRHSQENWEAMLGQMKKYVESAGR